MSGKSACIARLLRDIEQVGMEIEQCKTFERRMVEIAAREFNAGNEDTAKEIAQDLDLALVTCYRRFVEDAIAPELGRMAERLGL